jgi:hypothetical protein
MEEHEFLEEEEFNPEVLGDSFDDDIEDLDLD